MAIHLDPNATSSVIEPTVTPAATPAPRVAAHKPVPSPQKASPAAPSPHTAAPEETLSVTFTRDAQGQIYYVVTDPQSGKEIRETPPAEVRKAGEGIAEFLKQEQAKNISHIDKKA